MLTVVSLLHAGCQSAASRRAGHAGHAGNAGNAGNAAAADEARAAPASAALDASIEAPDSSTDTASMPEPSGSKAPSTNAAEAGAAASPASGGQAAGAPSMMRAAEAGSAGHATRATGAAGRAADPDDAICMSDFDPAHLPKRIEPQGSVLISEPSVIAHDGRYYLFSAGPGVPIRTSNDMVTWQDAGRAFQYDPRWIARTLQYMGPLGSPDISLFDGTYHLYYSASREGGNRSCIGHATAATPAGPFDDHGAVLCSNVGSQEQDWNAVHPAAVQDAEGKRYLAFGSFWSGIKLIALDASGHKPADGAEPIALAMRPKQGGAIEAPFIVQHCGHYYLFVSFDLCCDGVDSTYKVYVGRANAIEGPYLDREGKPMLEGGGSPVIVGDDVWHGPGQNMLLRTPQGWRDLHHAYYSGPVGPIYQEGAAYLRISELAWDEQGWPVSGGP